MKMSTELMNNDVLRMLLDSANTTRGASVKLSSKSQVSIALELTRLGLIRPRITDADRYGNTVLLMENGIAVYGKGAGVLLAELRKAAIALGVD